MAKAKGFLNKVAHEPIFHKTSIGRHPSLTKMNKSVILEANDAIVGMVKKIDYLVKVEEV